MGSKPKGQVNISTKILVNIKRCTLEEKIHWKGRKDIHCREKEHTLGGGCYTPKGRKDIHEEVF